MAAGKITRAAFGSTWPKAMARRRACRGARMGMHNGRNRIASRKRNRPNKSAKAGRAAVPPRQHPPESPATRLQQAKAAQAASLASLPQPQGRLAPTDRTWPSAASDAAMLGDTRNTAAQRPGDDREFPAVPAIPLEMRSEPFALPQSKPALDGSNPLPRARSLVLPAKGLVGAIEGWLKGTALRLWRVGGTAMASGGRHRDRAEVAQMRAELREMRTEIAIMRRLAERQEARSRRNPRTSRGSDRADLMPLL